MSKTYQVNPDEELPKVERMLCDLAWRTALAYPVLFEEAKSEAYYAFMRACEQFDRTRGSKFSTWCYFWVWTHLKTFVTRRSVDPLYFTDTLPEEAASEEPSKFRECLEEVINDLSEDAKEIMSLLLETPKELMNRKSKSRKAPVVTPHQLLRQVKNFLIERRKWDKQEVDTALDQLRRRLRWEWA